MQLEFNKKTAELKIKDEVPMHAWLVIALLLINGINMAVQLFLMKYKNNEILYIFMFILAVISLGVICYYIFKKSWKSKYLLSEIEGLEIKKSQKKEHVFLKLRNGKRRSFSTFKNKKEQDSFKKTLTSMGIKPI